MCVQTYLENTVKLGCEHHVAASLEFAGHESFLAVCLLRRDGSRLSRLIEQRADGEWEWTEVTQAGGRKQMEKETCGEVETRDQDGERRKSIVSLTGLEDSCV
jgi:hypothetical protein